ncbi:germin-like protein 5-1 [Lolium rigidum]|uniref:germin-like protein 5-1 n=1 Tax=Lolium rigidum TaxID=89674 RepID=UPI001F5CF208|nr:germin-like protein 5-1 [Lolium rigidum]
MMARSCSSLFLAAVAVAVALVLAVPSLASDPDNLQDICVADLNSELKLNGFPCKANATAEDFFSGILAKPGATNTTSGSVVTGANVEKVPGLNTLGVSLSRIDYAPGGLNPPHTHPRATELVFVLYGELDVGFITTANKLFAKTISEGDVFAFPRGLVHFQKNSGDKPAAVISAFNSQLPGTQSIAITLFGASPEVPDDVLAKAFQIGTEEVDKIKSKFAPKS